MFEHNFFRTSTKDFYHARELSNCFVCKGNATEQSFRGVCGWLQNLLTNQNHKQTDVLYHKLLYMFSLVSIYEFIWPHIGSISIKVYNCIASI